MNEHLGLLFSDGSILLLPDGADLRAASAEAAEHDAGDLSPSTQPLRAKKSEPFAKSLPTLCFRFELLLLANGSARFPLQEPCRHRQSPRS